jgi:oligoendopeptidase F
VLRTHRPATTTHAVAPSLVSDLTPTPTRLLWTAIALPALLLAAALACGPVAAQEAGKVPQRSDLDAAHKWKLEGIYATSDAWDAEFARLEALVAPWAAMKGHLGASGDSLLAALVMQDTVGVVSGRLYTYATLRLAEDNRVSQYQGMVDRINGLLVRVGAAGAFMSPEILSIPPDRLAGFQGSVPGLARYRHALDDVVRLRPHTLPEEQEKQLAMAGEMGGGPGAVFSAFDDADLRYGTIRDEEGQEVEVTKGRYAAWLESPDRRVRRDAYRAMFGAYAGFNNTLGACLNADLKGQLFFARARRYDTVLESSLDADALPVSVYRSLIATANANLEPLHRYARLRKQWLGLDTLKVYDLYVPLVQSAKVEVPYEKARRELLEGLKPLGPVYMSAFARGLDAGWIDPFETQGKTSGAFSGGSYTTQPYVLLNWSGTLEDEFTLAHEMGHSMHSFLTWQKQPPVYSNYSTFVAEVASTTNEALLIDYLLKQKITRDQRLFLLNHYLEQIRSTFFRQVLLAEFELGVHEMAEKGEPVTAEAMNKLYGDLYRRYYGSALDVDSLAERDWSRVPHFYRHYYVFQYATSYAASVALSQKILTQGQPAVARYLDFLGAGSSEYPIEVLRKAGVDMTTPAPFEATVAKFSQLLDEMEKLWRSR